MRRYLAPTCDDRCYGCRGDKNRRKKYDSQNLKEQVRDSQEKASIVDMEAHGGCGEARKGLISWSRRWGNI